MDCKEIRREIFAAEGRPPPARDPAIGEHLSRCPDCARLDRWWKSLREGLARLPRPAAPPGTLERAVALIRAKERDRRAAAPLLRMLASAAAVLLLATSMAILLTSRGPEPAERADLVTELSPDEALDRMMAEMVRDNVNAVPGGEVDR